MSIELRRRCRSHLPAGPSLSIVELKNSKTVNQKITFQTGKINIGGEPLQKHNNISQKREGRQQWKLR